jgi:hypothetical protein
MKRPYKKKERPYKSQNYLFGVRKLVLEKRWCNAKSVVSWSGDFVCFSGI